MKLWVKILIIAIIVFVLVFDAAYIFLILRGKSLMKRALENATGSKVTIGYLGITFPLNIRAKNFDIENVAKADSVFISPNILGFLTGKIAFNDVKLVNPVFYYHRKITQPALATNALPSAAVSTQAAAAPAPAAGKRPPRIVIRRFKVVDGAVNITDDTAGKNGIRFTIKNINFTLRNFFTFPGSYITSFDLNARIPWAEGSEEGRIEANGWLNFARKDMQAKLNIRGIDGIYLYPYYSQWVDLEKARIQSAKLNFISDIQGLDNNVTANCHLELVDIVRKPIQEGEDVENASKIADAMLDIFRAMNQGKIVLDFTIRTKMDRPEFGFANVKMAFEDKLQQAQAGRFKPQDILLLPSKLWEGGVNAATQVTKAVYDGTIAVGNKIRETVQRAPKVEPAPAPVPAK